MKKSSYRPFFDIQPDEVLHELRTRMLIDGFDYVLDTEHSVNTRLVDARSQKHYLDFFTCFASTPLGMNHPSTTDDEFIRYLGEAALNKPSNSDVYSEVMASFVKTLRSIAVPDYFKHYFFVEGGALAIENALKTAFDWKVRKNFRKGYVHEKGHQILHFKQAFHGRSGYTMSLTNTDVKKVALYPKFDWPRVSNPQIFFPLGDHNMEELIARENLSIAQIKQAFVSNPDDIAAIIIEPIQGEGGDNHFRPEFLQQLRTLADENDALLIFDEVQTGVGLTGTMWVHEQLGVQPDIMSFGKKMQVCGIFTTDRIDDIDDNVFRVPSRINSTWGGNYVDMARATKYLEVIHQQQLLQNAQEVGKELQAQLQHLSEEFPTIVSNPRGRGLFCAFDIATADIRSKLLEKCYENGLIILGCGDKSVRFRPALTLTTDEMIEGITIIRTQLATM
jgi:L-lysine 6-transaminase